MANTPWNAPWHLRAELARVSEMLAGQLRRQRERGRTPAVDAVQGFVIEDGEAEGLAAELAAAWGRPSTHATGARCRSTRRGEIAVRADQGAAQGAFLPLRHAARAFDLFPEEYTALLLALAVEMDPRFGRLVAYLNDHVGRTWPTIGLALTLASPESDVPSLSPVAFCERPVVRDGLLELEGDGPLPGLSLRLPREILRRLTEDSLLGPDSADLHLSPPEPGFLDRLQLEASVRDRLRVWAEDLRQGRQVRPLLLAGAPGSGRTTAARAAASTAGLPLVVAEAGADQAVERLRAARREACWCGAALLVRVVPGAQSIDPDWRAVWAGLAGLRIPPLLALPPDMVEGAAAAAPEEPAVLRLTEPGPALRARLWRALLPPGERIKGGDLDALAGRFHFGPGRIARAVRRAAAEVSVLPRGERRLTAAVLERACREVGSAAMGALAQKLSLPYERADLVVPAPINAELDLAVAWVRHQRRVLDDWGFARRVVLGRGLTALFAGPPGTGKTMAAQVLARELGLDLYRVDLSRVMSKWIGETEKNLGRLFDDAHAAGAVLFFDEADALFGKRSEVKDAHDRYANVEIGYLLQRMEEHDGVTVLATNRARDLDEAFARRFQVVADFPMPDEGQRLRIWQGMFPPQAAREPALDLARVARDFEVSGGEIKNAVLAAAYLAAAEGRPVGMAHLKRAICREVLKNGRVIAEGDLP